MLKLMVLSSILSFLGLSSNPIINQTHYTLGTVCTIQTDASEKTLNKAFDKLYEIDQLLNRYKDDSKIVKDLDDENLISLASFAKDYSKKYEEFNPLLGNLVDYWGFAGDKEVKVPTKEEIKFALDTSNIDNLVIENDKITLKNGAKLDLSSIGKGYACDSLDPFFKDTNTLINLGGNIKVYGESKRGLWNIGLQDPNDKRGSYIAIVKVKGDTSVVTSGLYEQSVTIDSKTYSHILDPKTGYTANNDLTGTVIISKSSLLCDLLSTTCFVQGVDKALETVKKENVDFVFITKNKTLYVSKNLKDRFILKDKSYNIKYI